MALFTHEVLSSHIIRIQDPLGVFLYLIKGNESACLLDTGYGYGDVKAYAQQLCDLPIFVILTHGHIDHAGGAGLFDRVYLNPKEKPVFQQHMDPSFRRMFFKQYQIELPLEDLAPVGDWTTFLPIEDKQEWSLGGITLQAIEVCGHTPGMSMVLMKEERTILFGDGCGVSVLLFDEYSTSVQTYYESLQGLKAYEPAYDIILRNHGTGASEKDLLDEVMLCCQDILSKQDDHVPVELNGEQLYFARAVDEHQNRIDGKFGNIAYRMDKVEECM